MTAIIGIGRIAAPAGIDKPPDNADAQRIIMDIIRKLHQVSIVFNQDALSVTKISCWLLPLEKT